MNKITIRADLLQGMAILTSKDESRPKINCVCLSIRNKVIRLIATDGKIMGMYLCDDLQVQYTIEETGPAKISLPIPDFRRLGCGSAKLNIEQDGVETRFIFGDFTQRIKNPMQPFPEMDGAVPPAMDPITQINLDLVLLHRFTEALKKMGSINPGSLKIRGGVLDNDTKEIRSYHVFSQDERFYGVIAPLSTNREYTVPAWATETLTPPTEATTQEPTLPTTV